jgi:hypothetical protein
VKKILFAAGFLAAAISTGWAQVYGYPSGPYGYRSAPYGSAYSAEPYALPPGYYGYDPYGTAYNWDYYRVDGPGRGFGTESTR